MGILLIICLKDGESVTVTDDISSTQSPTSFISFPSHHAGCCLGLKSFILLGLVAIAHTAGIKSQESPLF